MQAVVTVGQAERLKGRVNTGKSSFREGHFIFFFQSVHGSYKGGPRQNGRRRHRRIPLALRHLNNRPALHSLAQSVEDIVVPAELIDYYTRTLIINSGAKSERFVKKEYPGLPAQAFVHYGNFIGETLKIAAKLKVPLVTLGIMIGKAVKLAEGNLDTHSKKVVMNKEFLRQVAMEAGCSPDVESMIEKLTLARELWTLLSEEDSGKFFPCLLEHCFAHCVPLLPEGKLTILLIDEEGNIPFRIQ